jgi:hypothetical protein
MPACFSAYMPDRAALVRLLDDDTIYRVGRADDCQLRLDHPSISRQHAELQGSTTQWSLKDMASKNGLRVDGHMVAGADIDKPTWFAIGDVYCQLEPLDSSAAETFRKQTESRRSTSRWLSARLSPSLGIRTLIPQTLDIVLELAGLDRGFVLYAVGGEPLRVCASRGLMTREIASASFAGSVAAVDRALESGQSIVCCDTDDSPWLGARPSVRLGGIRAIVCIPLRLPDASLGAIYADSRKPGAPITELDLELLQNVAERATAALSATHLQREVNQLVRSAADIGIQAPRWDDLHTPRQD